MLKTGLTAIALVLGSGVAASAQTALDSVLSALRGQDFGSFEVEREAGQIKVEATRGTTERELVWDAATGKLLKDETGRADGRIASRSGDDDRTDDRPGSGRSGAEDDDHGGDRTDDHGGSRSGGGQNDDDDDHGGGGDRGDDHGGRGSSGGGSDHGGGSDDDGGDDD